MSGAISKEIFPDSWFCIKTFYTASYRVSIGAK